MVVTLEALPARPKTPAMSARPAGPPTTSQNVVADGDAVFGSATGRRRPRVLGAAVFERRLGDGRC